MSEASFPAYLLERTQIVPRPVGEVFRFFADAFNLEAITPPFLRFRIVTPPPIVMDAGTLIDYRLQLFGVPFRWRTRIERFEPDAGFVDVQLSGPYRLWHHTHAFEALGAVTRMCDRVRYALPLGPLGRLAHAALVGRTLETIFDYRRDRISELFA
jgi:ligand-binding SRPBCC domain-containing protein